MGKKLTGQLLKCPDCNVVLCSYCYSTFHTVDGMDESFKKIHERSVLLRMGSKGANKMMSARKK